MEIHNYRELLKAELEKRKDINENYSLRSFARYLEISAPRLSQVISGKSGLSYKAAKELSKKLKFDSKKTDWFLNSVGAEHSRGTKDRKLYTKRFKELQKASKTFSELQLEYFKVISDWYHYAILELTYIDDFKNDINWISKTLNVDDVLIKRAIERLKKLELIKEVDGTLKDCFINLSTTNDIPSASIKKFNAQLIKKANVALYEQEVSQREISSNIIAIAKKDILIYKEKIRDFRRSFCNDTSANKNDVYTLNIQFFSLTTNETQQ